MLILDSELSGITNITIWNSLYSNCMHSRARARARARIK